MGILRHSVKMKFHWVEIVFKKACVHQVSRQQWGASEAESQHSEGCKVRPGRGTEPVGGRAKPLLVKRNRNRRRIALEMEQVPHHVPHLEGALC